MKINLSRRTIICPVIIVLLIFLFIMISDIVNRNSVFYQYWKILRSTIILATAWLTMRFIILAFINPINEKRKKPLPNIVKDLIGAFVYLTAVSVIITVVYDKTILSVWTFFISSWAIVGFAAKDIIAECMHGIYLDFQSDFEIEDWIQFKDGTIGKIIKMKMTGVEILLQNNTVLFITNTLLSNEPIINLSKPENGYYLSTKLNLDFSVPISQARKVISDAMKKVAGIKANDFKVFAESIQETGVIYVIYFKVLDQSNFSEVKHQVLQSVTEHLRKFNLNIAQIQNKN